MSESIVPRSRSQAQAPRADFLARVTRKALLGALQRIHSGRLTLIENREEFTFGEATAECPLDVVLHVHNPRFYAWTALEGSVGAGQTFIWGDWDTNDLAGLVRLLVRNREALDHVDSRAARIAQPFLRGLHWLRRNTRDGARKNIEAHYDLGNDFYQLFLDETMTYSSAIFETADTPLADASREKLDRLCSKLDLQPSDRVVEIGTGWGSFALHAAKNYGCHVTTTTISREQYEYAKKLIARGGMGDRVTLLFEDYRDLRGEYDKAVSIEMIEAVGWQYYETYMEKVASLLKPNGAFAMQAITIRDDYYERARRDVDFIKKFIFPGCCIPSTSALTNAAARTSDLSLHALEDITPHYAKTLRTWRERFFARVDEVEALGYSDEFIRMWDFYLSYCEGGFAERNIGTMQLVFAKPQCQLPGARNF